MEYSLAINLEAHLDTFRQACASEHASCRRVIVTSCVHLASIRPVACCAATAAHGPHSLVLHRSGTASLSILCPAAGRFRCSMATALQHMDALCRSSQ